MRSITVFLSFFLLITLAFCRRTSADLKDEQGPSNYFIRAPVEYIVPDANNQAAVNYALPSSDYTTYNVPLTYYYQNPSGVYWPPLNNVPNANIPTIYQVPFGNVPTYCPYPYPCVPNNTPIGGIPSVPNVPNGIYPTARPVTPRPAYPQSPPRGYTPKPESDDENLGRREPLQPGSDGVMDPEVGLSREKLVKYGPTMFGGTFDLDNMRFDGFSSWMKLLSASAKPWWKGPNVCVSKEEDVKVIDDDESENKTETRPFGLFFTGSVNIHTCVDYGTKYECTLEEQNMGMTKIMKVTYQCCHGSQLHNRRQCIKSEILPLIETIKSLNGTEYLAITHGLVEMMTSENITIFLPSNEAFEKFADKMLLTNQIEMFIDPSRRRRSVRGFSPTDLAMNHMIKGFHDIFSDESFNSMYKDGILQIKYTNEGRMVNCAKIDKSHHATNGFVHTIDRVLMPVTRNISQILADRPEFSILTDLLNKTGLLNDFAENEIWTLFAPTNEAFEKLDEKVFKKMINVNGCVKNILRYHMLSSSLCSSEVTRRFRLINSMGSLMKLAPLRKENDDDEDFIEDSFKVDNIRVVKPDILATNGIIHAINEIIIPESATPITGILQQKNLTKFYSLIKKAGMLDEIQSYGNTTFFVPTDKAFENYINDHPGYSFLKSYLDHEDEVDGPMTEKQINTLRTHIKHHITKGAIQSCSLKNNEFLETFDDNTKIRMNLYSTTPITNTYNRATVHCARLLHFDYEQCDNVLHQIDRPLVLYEGNIFEQIGYFQNLTMLNKILPGTETEKILKDSEDITFLAPVNEAFDSISKADYEELLTNKKMVDTILKQHVIRGVSCCSGLTYIPWPFTSYLKAFNDVKLEVHNKQIGNAPIKSCDHVASNGVLHLTNKIMVPRSIQQGNRKSNFDILLFGFND